MSSGWYSADFETTTKEDDCRVWAWCSCDIYNTDDIQVDNNIDSFMFHVKQNPGTYYFHNLKFDGNFILYWLFKQGYKWKNQKKLNPGEFNTLISDMGTWYTITVCTKPNKNGATFKVKFVDSLKIIPLSVDEIPAAYNLPEHKLNINYTEDRPIGHKLTQEEEEYVKADVIIVAKAVRFMLEHGQTKLTSAANALADFKSRFDKAEYNRLFPALNKIMDKDIRKSYKGGWTYLNPKFRNKRVSCGTVYDVNSMYPWAMKYCLLPYGKPVYFSGEYKPNKQYPLYVIQLVAEFKLKPHHYPSIQVKNSPGWYRDNEYIEKSIAPTVLTLTSVDYDLFMENYEVDIIEVFGGYMFHAKHGMFDEYIDYWYEQKTEAKRTGNKGLERIAKLMLNSLYGKFGARCDGYSKEPWYDEIADIVRYKKSELEDRTGGYIPIATFITSYCRDKIIRGANAAGERFIYADTDSLHVEGNKPIDDLDVDDYKLGAFKAESEFIRAMFIRQKTYLEIEYDAKRNREKMNLKCCGMPNKLKETIEENDFYEGAVYDSTINPKFKPKLVPKVVPGGVILKETTFQIAKAKPVEPTVTIILDGKEYSNVRGK